MEQNLVLKSSFLMQRRKLQIPVIQISLSISTPPRTGYALYCSLTRYVLWCVNASRKLLGLKSQVLQLKHQFQTTKRRNFSISGYVDKINSIAHIPTSSMTEIEC